MYEVTVTMSRRGYDRSVLMLSGPDDHAPDQMSDLLLQAADAVQRQLDLPSSLAELVAARGTFGALSSQLDELGVPRSEHHEGMTALVHRLAALGNEVRDLRAGVGAPETVRREHAAEIDRLIGERDSAHAVLRTHGKVINEVRRRLGALPSTSDMELPRIIGELAEDRDRWRRDVKNVTDTLREVREAVNAGPGITDDKLGRFVRAWQIGIAEPEHVRELREISRVVADADGGEVPQTYDTVKRRIRSLASQVGRFHSVLEWLGMPPGYWATSAPRAELYTTVSRVADNSDEWIAARPKLKSMLQAMRLPHDFYLTASEDELSSLTARVVEYSDRWLELTPERVAQAMHTARCAAQNGAAGGVPLFLGQPWEQLRPQDQGWYTRVAESALRELAAWPRVADTERQRWQQALNRVRLDAGLPMRTVEEVGDRSEFEQVTDLLAELRLDAGSSSATPEQLARALFDASREVVRKRGTEPLHDTDTKPWDCAYERRKDWWRALASRTLDDVGALSPTPLLPVTAERLAFALHKQFADADMRNISVLTADGVDLPGDRDRVRDEVFDWDPENSRAQRRLIEQCVRALDDVGALSPTSPLPVTPEQLAQAVHIGVGSAGPLPPGASSTWVPWEQRPPQINEWATRVMEIALSELPQIARRDAESESSFVAHMDAVTSELRQRIAVLEAENGKQEDEMDAALDVVHEVAGLLGMSADRRVKTSAFGPMVVEAVRQLKARHEGTVGLGLTTRGLMYQGMLMSVADQLGLPAGSIDDPRAFGEMLRAELAKRSGVALNFCAPKPEDWMVRLSRTADNPGGVAGVRSVSARHGYHVLLGGIEYAVEFAYTGGLPQRPDGRLLLPSVTPEQLAQAWLETPTAIGESLSWDEVHPDVRESIVDHAVRVIEQLSPQSMVDLAPGEAFAFGDDGPRKFRVFSLSQAKLKGFRAGVPELDRESLRALLDESLTQGDSDAAAIAGLIERLSGGKIRASAQSSASLLAQLRELGAHVRTLEALFARLAEEVDARGDSNEYVVELVEQKLRESGKWMQQVERRTESLTRELAEAMGRAPEPPLGGSWGWGELLREVSHQYDWRRKAITREGDLRRALRMPDHVSWDALVAYAAQAHNAVGHLQRKLGLQEQAYPGPLFKAVDDLKAQIKTAGAAGSPQEELAEHVRRMAQAAGVELADGRKADTLAELNKLANAAVSRIVDTRTLAERIRLLDLAVALGRPDSSDSWEHLIGLVADQTAAHTGHALELNVFEPGERKDARRVKDAILTLADAAGIDPNEDQPDVAVQKAGDAAAILRSWPDVARAAGMFDGNKVEQPDEVAPALQGFAEKFSWTDPPGLFKALERLLAAHRGEPLKDDAGTMYDRVDNTVKRLFAVVEETGRAHGLHFASGDSKVVFADRVLLSIRNAVVFSPAPMWVALADQVASRMERWADADPEPLSKLVKVPGVGIMKDRETLRFAADVVRTHAAELVSGGHPHPLVMAEQDGVFWSPSVGSSELELVPDADGDVVFRDDTQSADGKALGLLVLGADEVAPVGAALLMLAAHRLRAKGSPAANAVPITRIRVTPTVPQTWCYGPNSIDPDPAKRWHIGCGGEVLTVDGVDICGDCSYEWPPDVDLQQVVEAAEQQESTVVESAVERDAAADAPDQDTES
jgi:hypothetical protein